MMRLCLLLWRLECLHPPETEKKGILSVCLCLFLMASLMATRRRGSVQSPSQLW